MHMYNLIEYSDNYADSSESLYQFKRDEPPINDAGNTLNVALDNSTYFKYKASLSGKADDADGIDRSLKNTKIFVPLKYLSNFKFKIRSTKLYVPVVNVSTKDNVNLTKQLNEGFKLISVLE